MKKTLIEQDELYRSTISELSNEERIEYCYDLIDKNQKILTNQGLELPKLKRLMITELIEAAQKEIKALTGIKTIDESISEEDKKDVDDINRIN